MNELEVYTYILQLNDNSYYTGITKNIVIRFAEHNAGESKSTRHSLPASIVYLNKFGSYKEARKLEVYIKNRGAFRFLNDLRWKQGERYGQVQLRGWKVKEDDMMMNEGREGERTEEGGKAQ